MICPANAGAGLTVVDSTEIFMSKKKHGTKLLGQLEHSYETRKDYWKGGTVGVYGYGGGRSSLNASTHIHF